MTAERLSITFRVRASRTFWKKSAVIGKSFLKLGLDKRDYREITEAKIDCR
jgi:hypothetical protein